MLTEDREAPPIMVHAHDGIQDAGLPYGHAGAGLRTRHCYPKVVVIDVVSETGSTSLVIRFAASK